MWAALPVALAVIGTVMQGNAAAQTGASIQSAKEFEAQQLEQNAGQTFAASQRKALEAKRQGRLVESRALAVAAASGGGTGGNVMDLIANLHAQSSYRASVALYEGEDRQRQMMMAAEGKRFEGETAKQAGEQKRTASYISALGQASSLYSNYGGSGPQQAPAPVESRTPDNSGINWDL